MVREIFVDLESETYPGAFLGWRCVVCGAILDPVILSHQAERSESVGARIRHRKGGIVVTPRTEYE
jgi:hypothetical protein